MVEREVAQRLFAKEFNDSKFNIHPKPDEVSHEPSMTCGGHVWLTQAALLSFMQDNTSPKLRYFCLLWRFPHMFQLSGKPEYMNRKMALCSFPFDLKISMLSMQSVRFHST
jgi:hypothetical protein